MASFGCFMILIIFINYFINLLVNVNKLIGSNNQNSCNLIGLPWESRQPSTLFENLSFRIRCWTMIQTYQTFMDVVIMIIY